VVVFAALHTERSSRLRGRRPAKIPPGAVQPEPVPITRVTVIAAQPFDDEASGRDWLQRCGGRGEHGGDEIANALAHVNHAVAAYRVCAADPHAHDVSRDQAVRVRLGYGTGAGLVDGGWDEAIVVPGEHSRPRVRRRMLAPEQELAGILTGRRARVQPSEELLLRARLDLDAGRHVEAALETRAAAEALGAELEREGTGKSTATHTATATRLSKAAMSDGLSNSQLAELTKVLTELERYVRRRRYAEPD
jgi:hypothetical protein